MATEEYAPGRLVDVVGEPDRGVALLWHGRGIDQRSSMKLVAERIGAGGALALAADWSSEAADGGRADLLGSLRFARELAERHGRDAGTVVLVGWSLGGTAAVSIAVHAKRLGIAIGGCLLVAPGDGPRAIDPISGLPLPATFPHGAGRCPVDVVYGERDRSATPDLVTGLEMRLRASGWVTTLHGVDADHSEVVGMRFDERTERYLPSRSSAARAALHVVGALAVDLAPTSSS